MDYSYQTELDTFALGQRYINLGPNLVSYLDSIIRFGNSKISTIKFLRGELQIGLTLAKQLYEAREEFLNQTRHPYGWER